MSQSVKRACDACHRRKVKCDGINPCRNCSSAQLSCTYNAIPQKKGPKGSRAKVISELRETQRLTSLSAKVQNRMNGIPCPQANTLSPTPGMVTSDLVKDCATFFFDNMYAQAPILDRRQVEQQLLYMEQNRDAYCLMSAMCAFVMLQPGMSMPPGDPYNLDMVPGANIISSQLLLEEALKVRKGYDYLDSVTLNALATNFFVFACYYGQEMHDKAWFYLREATTMMSMIGMDKEEHYMHLDAVEAARRRRLYWLFYSVERAYAIQRGRPLTLKATINLPTLADDPSDPLAHQLHSFIMLVNIYRPFDDAFVAVWNKTRAHFSTQFVSGLQKQQNDLSQTWSCQDPNFTDFRTNQQWLKNTVWQLTNGAPSPSSDDPAAAFYNGDMARDLLLNLASSFPNQTLDIVGTGLIEKLVEVSFSLTEFLSIQPASRDPFAVGPREFLTQILTSVALARHGEHRFLPLLMSKVSDILPRTINPMLQNAPENINMANVDIFDGFGNAGMAQPPMQMMDTDYAVDSFDKKFAVDSFDKKFSVETYDKKYALDMNTQTTPDSANSHPNHTPPGSGSGSDMGNSFVASPDIMSPTGMEYPHSINTFGVNSMSDMVVSPIGNGPSQQQQQHSMHIRQGMSMNNMVNLNHPQRQGSFHMQGTDFHGIPADLDFSSIR